MVGLGSQGWFLRTSLESYPVGCNTPHCWSIGARALCAQSMWGMLLCGPGPLLVLTGF